MILNLLTKGNYIKMGRSGQAVYKFSLRGKLVKRYDSVKEAVLWEGVSRWFLVKAMCAAEPLNNHVFSLHNSVPVRKKKVTSVKARLGPKPALWEGSGGMFDVDGWAAVCK